MTEIGPEDRKGKRKLETDHAEGQAKSQKTEATGKHPNDWSCPSCNYMNYASRVSCKSCNTPKPAPAASTTTSATEGKHPGDWNCPQCQYLNYASRAACFKCQTPKAGAWPQAGYASMYPQFAGMGGFGGAAAQTNFKNPLDWACYVCGEAHNYASRQHCRKCNSPRPTGVQGFSPFGTTPLEWALLSQQTAAQSAEAAAAMGADPAAAAAMSMNMLQAAAASSMLPFMAAQAPAVASPAVPKGLRAGDWSCASCFDHNYASRTTCRKCSAPKPDAPVLITGGRGGDWLCSGCGQHNYGSRNTCKKCAAAKTAEAVQKFREKLAGSTAPRSAAPVVTVPTPTATLPATESGTTAAAADALPAQLPTESTAPSTDAAAIPTHTA